MIEETRNLLVMMMVMTEDGWMMTKKRKKVVGVARELILSFSSLSNILLYLVGPHHQIVITTSPSSVCTGLFCCSICSLYSNVVLMKMVM